MARGSLRRFVILPWTCAKEPVSDCANQLGFVRYIHGDIQTNVHTWLPNPKVLKPRIYPHACPMPRSQRLFPKNGNQATEKQ
eukprot:5087426-Amphidinium_carterae.2